ncbi:MAG: flagellar M-ring protein FliF [Rhizobacter sp.]|nr:flagellar M-ring protein FliF [Bacteriovorax sp.]
MQDILEKIVRNFREFFNGLDSTKKIGFIVLTCIIMAAMTGIVVWASKTRYDVLYTDLNKEDARKIAIILEEKKIPYQTSNEGKTLSIPEDLVGVWRLEIAKLGTSFSGTVGYEVFDKQSFGTTSFVQKVNKQRALEGELVKSIMYIQGVKRARVHISIPESSPFVSEKKPPSASIVLELNNGVSLTPAEVKGVASLVASSVEEMRPENVVILDDRGKKLSENIGDPMTATTANRLALEAQLNQKYEKQIEDILGHVVGDGKVVAKVTVDLDYTESVSTATSYDNENSAVISEVKNSQNMNGSRPSPQGMVGARANLPGEDAQPAVAETKNNVIKELTTKNFNVPTTVTQSKKPAANVKAISAAVMIDGKRVPVLDENGAVQMDKAGNPIMKYEKWSAADLENFQQIVASTLGTSDKRGDKLIIKNMEFAREDMTVADALLKEQANRELIRNIVKYLAVGLTISLFFFLVVRPFIQWVTDNTIETVEDFLPRTLEELEKVQANQRLPGLEDALPQIEEKLNPEKIEGNMLREKIIALVENNPGKAAQVIHEMIHASESDKQIA